ncbi:MAG: class I SAM-dependent methyltransferase [Planctomycetota bacterium]
MESSELVRLLLDSQELLKAVELAGPDGQIDARKAKKLREVAGFCRWILKYVDRFLGEREAVRIVEFSCGKSYLGIVLVLLLERLQGKRAELVGVDVNAELVEKCRRVARRLGMDAARFVCGRTLEFGGQEPFDLAVALHACDTATDEAIARGIQLEVPLVMVVPCCQNQIRGQIKAGHPLTAMTEFGPARYRLANLLTDVLRAQFLRSAGYHVEMLEIGSPRLTPKNLLICARKVKRAVSPGRDRAFRMLKEFFGVKPKVEQFCPGIIGEEPG